MPRWPRSTSRVSPPVCRCRWKRSDSACRWRNTVSAILRTARCVTFANRNSRKLGEDGRRQAQQAVRDEQRERHEQHGRGLVEAVDDLLQEQRHADVGRLGEHEARDRRQHAALVLPQVRQERADRRPVAADASARRSARREVRNGTGRSGACGQSSSACSVLDRLPGGGLECARMNSRRQARRSRSASAALTAPLSPLAQQAPKTYRVGFLSAEAASDRPRRLRAFRHCAGLRELGYVEGRNLVIEARLAEGKLRPAARALRRALVAMKVDVLVVSGTKAADRRERVPRRRFPSSWGAPAMPSRSASPATLRGRAGNVTGWTFFGTEVSSKLVELLKECAPRTARLGYLLNPAESGYAIDAIQRAAASLRSACRRSRCARHPRLASARLHRLDSRDAATPCSCRPGRCSPSTPRRSRTSRSSTAFPPASPLYEFAEVGRPPRRTGPIGSKVIGAPPSSSTRCSRARRSPDLPIEQASKFELMINMRDGQSPGSRRSRNRSPPRARLI